MPIHKPKKRSYNLVDFMKNEMLFPIHVSHTIDPTHYLFKTLNPIHLLAILF